MINETYREILIRIEDLISREYMKRDDDPKKRHEIFHYIT
jgi:hypothetical protein